MRELTHDEMKACIKAAQSALPEDAKDNGLILFFTADVTKGIWINRITTHNKYICDTMLEIWHKNLLTRQKFGTPKQN